MEKFWLRHHLGYLLQEEDMEGVFKDAIETLVFWNFKRVKLVSKTCNFRSRDRKAQANFIELPL